MSAAKSPLLGFYWDRANKSEGAGDIIDAEDHNRPAHFLETAVGNILLNLLVEDSVINRDPDVPLIDTDTGRIAVPPADNPIVGFLHGRGFVMTSAMEGSSTADSGDTTLLIDSGRTEGDDYWLDAYILFTSGVNSGHYRQVSDFDAATHTITWVAALPAAVSNGDTYTVTFYYIQDLAVNNKNYVYGRTLARTARDGVIQWVANTNGVKAEGDILVGVVWLDVDGNVEEADDSPHKNDRNLWAGAGAVHHLTLEGTIIGLAGGAYIDIVRPHHDLILFGPVEVDLTGSDISAEVIEWNRSGRVIVRITNGGGYVEIVDYCIHRWGRKKIYL